MMNKQDMILSEADDEPDSPVFSLNIPSVFDAELIIADHRWLDLVTPDLRAVMTEAISLCLAAAPQPAELSVLLADDATLADLNNTHRSKDAPTNVLSFPDDDGDMIGDIAIAYETVMAEAEDQGKSPADHLLHLAVHGVLHLLGHDHEDDAEAEVMEQREISILDTVGIANPYQEAQA